MESITKRLALRGELFEIERHTAFLIPSASRPAGAPTPWVWYARTLLPVYPDESEGWMFPRFLDRGLAVAGIDVGEAYGSPAGRATYARFHEQLVRERGLRDLPGLRSP